MRCAGFRLRPRPVLIVIEAPEFFLPYQRGRALRSVLLRASADLPQDDLPAPARDSCVHGRPRLAITSVLGQGDGINGAQGEPAINERERNVGQGDFRGGIPYPY
jgi:hypothetical protein